MKKLFAAILFLTALASPAFAAKKPPRQPHPKYDYRYHAPKLKYKAPKLQKHHSHIAHPHQAN